MGGWLWPDTDYGWLAFLVLTILAAERLRRARAQEAITCFVAGLLTE